MNDIDAMTFEQAADAIAEAIGWTRGKMQQPPSYGGGEVESWWKGEKPKDWCEACTRIGGFIYHAHPITRSLDAIAGLWDKYAKGWTTYTTSPGVCRRMRVHEGNKLWHSQTAGFVQGHGPAVLDAHADTELLARTRLLLKVLRHVADLARTGGG